MTNSKAPPKVLAVVILKLPNGQLVLQRRTDDAPVAAGKLGFFGGHIEEGETPEQCVKRELAEETSMDVNALVIKPVRDFLLPASVNYGQDRHFYIFETEVPNDTFSVYEGVCTESYFQEELEAREDISEVVKRVLENVIEN